ncbi:MAG: 3-hydroxyacyl-CoA dehydrogenase, partial [Sphingomonadales bacterium]
SRTQDRARRRILADQLAPELVSPGLLKLVGEDAPTRAILCAGAGNFAAAHVTLTHGYHAGGGADAGERVIANWDRVVAREGEIVPDYGFTQAEREIASAGLSEPVAATVR